jgi:hypothetical protein
MPRIEPTTDSDERAQWIERPIDLGDCARRWNLNVSDSSPTVCGLMDTRPMGMKAPPPPRPLGVSDDEAVELCQQWMEFLGATDSLAASADSGGACDLYSNRFLGWVDNRDGNLGIELVERAALISAADGRRALVFVSGGVYPDAQDRADALGVAILRFDPYSGDLDGANLVGRQLRDRGLAAQ